MHTGDYWLRHRDGPRGRDGFPVYEEDALICRRSPSWDEGSLLLCSVYAESLWRREHCARMLLQQWSFGLLLDGDAVLSCNGVHHDLQAGDTYLLRTGSRIVLHAGASGFVRKKYILLDSPLLDVICSGGSLAGVDVIRADHTQRVEEIYDRIKEAILKDDPYTRQEISTSCYSLLAELSRLATTGRYPSPLAAALELIEAKPQEELLLETLSRHCGVSSRTLSRLFHTSLGVSPVEYLIGRRLDLAKALLQVASMPIKEVAWRCGYKSESFFSRTFKQRIGVSPREFRNQSGTGKSP